MGKGKRKRSISALVSNKQLKLSVKPYLTVVSGINLAFNNTGMKKTFLKISFFL